MKLIRKTKSVCPECIKKIDAEIVEEEGKVYMLKECPNHGKFKVLLSTDVSYYKDLNNFYHSLYSKKDSIMPDHKQSYYQLYLTMKCNLKCPICYTNAPSNDYEEPTLEYIKNTLENWKNFKIGLYGGEPTIREDLPEIIKLIRETENIPVLYTNGIAIEKIGYLQKLIDSGLNIVHLQFDGFDDHAHVKIRGKRMNKVRAKALKNLKKLKIPTVLEATILHDINEKEMINILNFGVKNDFIRAIFFRSYTFLGKAGFERKKCLTVEEIIDDIEKQTNGKISKKKVHNFMKSFYIFSYILGTQRCFYNHYFLISRNNGDYKTVDDLIDLEGIQKNLEKYLKFKERGNVIAKPYLLISLLPKFFDLRNFPLFSAGFSIFKDKVISKKRFTGSNFPKNFLILGFATMCDLYTMDYTNIKNCVAGEIATDFGVIETAAMSKLIRERKIKNLSG